MKKERLFILFLCLNLTVVSVFALLLYHKQQILHANLQAGQENKHQAHYILLTHLDELDVLIKKVPYLNSTDIPNWQERLNDALSRNFHDLSTLLQPNLTAAQTVFAENNHLEELTQAKQQAAALFHTRADIFTHLESTEDKHHFTARMDGNITEVWVCRHTHIILAVENNRPVHTVLLSQAEILEKAEQVLQALGYTEKYPFHIRTIDKQIVIDFIPNANDQKQVLEGLRLRFALDNGRLTALSRFH